MAWTVLARSVARIGMAKPGKQGEAGWAIGRAIVARHFAVCFLTAAAFCTPSAALAGATDPTLAIGRFIVRPVAAATAADVTGVFGFDDALQVSYPLTLVVYQGTFFVRFPVGGTAESGNFAGLPDGLAVSEIASLEGAGTPESGAEMLALEPNRIQVSLPPSFFDGTVTAVLYVELPEEGGFTSNAVSTTLVGSGVAP